jgi:hypothetical protein
MPVNPPLNELKWLNCNPPLDELVARYPALWEDAGRELVATAKLGRVQKLHEGAARAKSVVEVWRHRIQKSRNNPKVIELALPHIVKSRMFILSLSKCGLAAAAGQVTGKVRLNLVNGYIIQKLLFSHDLVRKPCSLRRFKLWWRLITQKRLLMPLVQERGIYCFYSKELIRGLSALIEGRSCVEIAAGDGTLTRFLSEAGARVKATDDLSWQHAIKYPDAVENLDAKRALERYQPEAVICSWPPPGNSFERHVFANKSVQLYIVIGSRQKWVTGDWELYASQAKFDWSENKELSAAVLPPDGGNAVLVFRRKG